jgi:hypothetical protein
MREERNFAQANLGKITKYATGRVLGFKNLVVKSGVPVYICVRMKQMQNTSFCFYCFISNGRTMY